MQTPTKTSIASLILISLFAITGCGILTNTSQQIGVEPQLEPKIAHESTTYTLFTLNVHDWVYPESSAEAVNHVIDIHEQYNVPIDIYVTDPVFQYYVENADDLVKRLAESDMVCMSYHVRPPTPYYSGFDYIGLEEMDEEELYNTLMAYETHALDLETGLYTDKPGGYKFLADTIGYAPLVTGVSAQSKIGETLAKVYRDLGAKFIVEHGTEINLGDTKFGSYIRPEHKEVKLYELVRSHTGGEDVFTDAIADLTGIGNEFINLKYHENNFYLTGTPFWPVYWTDDKKSTALEPPFNTAISADTPEYRSKEMQDAHWALYEATVKYASEHADELNPINAFDLENMLEEILEETL